MTERTSSVASADGPEHSSTPLAGIRVVEISAIYSAPLAGVILAELGADVVKVEAWARPDLIRNQRSGPHETNPTFYALNRGKRFVSIDATTPDGRALLAELVEGADVFLTNMRPGKADAIGLGYAALAARNPRLVWAAITGLGSEGPDAEQRVYDYVVQARSGMVDYQRDPVTGRSSLISQVLVDKVSAQAVVQGILAALLVRERTGRGQRVEIPMLGAGLHFGWPDMMAPRHSEVAPPVPLDDLPRHLTLWPAAGLLVVRAGDGGEIAVSPFLPPWDGFAIALDRPEWVLDPRFAEAPDRQVHLRELLAEIDDAAARFDGADLLERFLANGVAAGPVQRRTDVHDDPQVRRLGLVSEHHIDRTVGRVRQPRAMWHFSESSSPITTRMGRVGEHTREVLRERGLDAQRIDGLFASGAVAEPEP